jgi:hypothetical protein
MAGVSIDDFGASFVDYLPGVVETLNDTVMVRKLARKDYRWEGANISFFVHTARNHALGFIEDGGAFATPNKQDYVEAKAYRKFLQGSVQITDGALANAATSKRAAIDVTTSELRGMINGLGTFEGFMAYLNGDGSVGDVGATDTSTGTALYMTDGRMMWDGATYQEYDSTLATNNGNIVVTSTARAPSSNGNASITVDAVQDGTAGNKIVWNGSVNRAITGLDKMVDDTSTTFQNVNTSTYPRYTSPVLSNSGTERPLTPTMFRQMLAMIGQESGVKPPSGMTVLTNKWLGIEVEELYEPELRITPSTKTAGIAIASFNSSCGKINIVPDALAPFNKMYFCDFSEIYRAVQKELDWRRQGGQIFIRSDVSAVWKATCIEICEYFIKQRNKCGKISDLTETEQTSY